MGRRAAEALSGSGLAHTIVISITDPGKPEAKIDPAVKDILRLTFEDVEPDVWEAIGVTLTYNAFSLDQAKRIHNFWYKHNNSDVHTLIVHCEAGISRSAGVAKVLAEISGITLVSSITHSNRHVENLLREAFSLPVFQYVTQSNNLKSVFRNSSITTSVFKQ